MTPRELSRELNEDSGLLGLTGDSDMRRVRVRAEGGEPEATRALAICAHRIRSAIGSAYAQLPELDALVFTGGVGENDHQLRRDVCDPLVHLGIELDQATNVMATGGEREVEIGSGRVRVLVLPTDEEQQIAAHTVALVSTTKGTPHVDHPAA
jgi:acetate kinase